MRNRERGTGGVPTKSRQRRIAILESSDTSPEKTPERRRVPSAKNQS